MAERRVTVHSTHDPLKPKKSLFIHNRIRTTKYTILTFLPKNLFEQFTRIANFYFLIIITLLQFPWAPIAAAAAILPLVIVIGVSAIREAVEDFLRYRSDQRINRTITHYLNQSAFEDVKWGEIYVGGIVKVQKDEQVPADVVLLAASNDDGIAFIDTCNLDGETNLKVRQALPATCGMREPYEFQSFQATIKCDLPNKQLYTFRGNLDIYGRSYPLDNRQVLLRGSVLRNTEWAVGVIVYTGHESKIMMNASSARSKRSKLEKGLNWKLVSIFIFLLVLATTGATAGFLFEKNKVNTGVHWYFYRNEENKRNPASCFFILFACHIVILNTMIPISLYVTLEVVRVIQALFILWDADMYDVETKNGAVARTTNISDDLGQIEHVFSDKTGTLTQNVMEFMKCSVNGKIYGDDKRKDEDTKGKAAFQDPDFEEAAADESNEMIQHFLWLLTTCHGVIPEADDKAPHGYLFQASSPDEGALVTAAANLGLVLTKRTQHSMTVVRGNETFDVEILAFLEFSSERKRSSIIIRHPITKEIVLYCKGADDVILDRLKADDPIKEKTKEDLNVFAESGLRTLCCGYRVFDETFFQTWSERFHEANCAINNREELVAAASEEVEKDLILIGATAIEDKLQEGVPHTIDSLLKANIDVWVITGDKKETAINIGYSCALLNAEMQLLVIDTDSAESITESIREFEEIPKDKTLGLVVSGQALNILFEEEHTELADRFFDFTLRCHSVICCRVSPLQKATIVERMQAKTKKLSLAIGDGANDVGMILKADVGVGISGKEGRQAVLASDYSISQFRFLQRLLFVHGRLNFYRNVDLIFYCFYKNIAFTAIQMFYAITSGFSGGTVYDSMLYMIYNVIFTCVPPVVFAGLERDVSYTAMMSIPELYQFDGMRRYYQSYLRFWLQILLGLAHAVITFVVCYYGCAPYVWGNGSGVGRSEFGTTVYSCIVVIANLRIAAMCHYWTWLHHLFIWGSILILPLVTIVLDVGGFSDEMTGTIAPLLGSAHYYIAIIAATIAAMIPVTLIEVVFVSRKTKRNEIIALERLIPRKCRDASSDSDDAAQKMMREASWT